MTGVANAGAVVAFARSSDGVYRVAPQSASRNVLALPLPTSGAEEIWLSSLSQLRSPEALGPVAQADLLAGLGNLLVITHPAFMADHARQLHPLNQFVAHRQGQGWKVSVISISDIQTHFGGGMAVPEALTSFLRAAKAQSRTVPHVLLVGSDSYDYRDILNEGSISFIPTKYAGTQFVRHTPSDGLLADVTGNGVADIPLGRWPVRTLDDLQATVQKAIDWDMNMANQRTSVWLTDERDPRLSPFSSQVERMSGILENAGWSVFPGDQIIFEEAGSAVAARNQLFDALEQGRSLTGFSGHGSPTFWSFQGILRPQDIAQLQNHGLPTLISTMACYTTYFVSPFSNTLAHTLMNGLALDAAGNFIADANGAVAVHGAATLSNIAQNEVFVREVLEAKLAGQTLGEAVLSARTTAAERGIRDLVINWTLLGDPTIRVH